MLGCTRSDQVFYFGRMSLHVLLYLVDNCYGILVDVSCWMGLRSAFRLMLVRKPLRCCRIAKPFLWRCLGIAALVEEQAQDTPRGLVLLCKFLTHSGPV